MQPFVKTDFAPDFYRRLGLAQTAGQADITRSYRKLAKKTHPDLNHGDPDATKKFVGINRAYECLSDKDQRAAYDAELAQHQASSSASRGAFARTDAIQLKAANDQKARPRARKAWHEAEILTPVFQWPEYTDDQLRRYYKALDRLEKGTARTNDLEFLSAYTDKPLGMNAHRKDQSALRRKLPKSIFDLDGPSF